MDDIEFDWVTGKVPRVDGAGKNITDDALSAGGRRREDGTLSGLAYDLEYTDENIDDDSDGSDRSAVNNAMLAAAVGIAVGVSATLAYVHREKIKEWLQDKVLNPIRRRWRHRSDADSEVSDATDPGDDLAAVASASHLLDEVTAGVEDNRILMGSDEAKERFLQIVLALGVIANNRNELQNAVIVDDEGLVELQRAVDLLTSERGLSVVNSMLEIEDSSRADEAQAAFLQVFGGGYREGSRFIPLRQESVRKQLALPKVEGEAPEHSE